jgi:2-phosphosulfolactate phosphatase
MEPELTGKKIAITTTNGTLAITKSVTADNVLIGSFLNIKAIANKIIDLNQEVVIHCAGWKGRVNAEDTLFAGALIELLRNKYKTNTDDASLAHALYLFHQDKMLDYIEQSSHAQRLKAFGIMKDIEFCLKTDKYDVVPFLIGDELTC